MSTHISNTYVTVSSFRLTAGEMLEVVTFFRQGALWPKVMALGQAFHQFLSCSERSEGFHMVSLRMRSPSCEFSCCLNAAAAKAHAGLEVQKSHHCHRPR